MFEKPKPGSIDADGTWTPDNLNEADFNGLYREDLKDANEVSILRHQVLNILRRLWEIEKKLINKDFNK